jgi:hypothetical protein
MHKYAPVHSERNVRLIVCNSHQRHLQLGSLSCELSLLGWMTQGYSANESEPSIEQLRSEINSRPGQFFVDDLGDEEWTRDWAEGNWYSAE